MGQRGSTYSVLLFSLSKSLLRFLMAGYRLKNIYEFDPEDPDPISKEDILRMACLSGLKADTFQIQGLLLMTDKMRRKLKKEIFAFSSFNIIPPITTSNFYYVALNSSSILQGHATLDNGRIIPFNVPNHSRQLVNSSMILYNSQLFSLFLRAVKYIGLPENDSKVPINEIYEIYNLIFGIYGTTLTSPFQEQVSTINFLVNHQREDLVPWLNVLEGVIDYELNNHQLFRITKKLSQEVEAKKDEFIRVVIMGGLNLSELPEDKWSFTPPATYQAKHVGYEWTQGSDELIDSSCYLVNFDHGNRIKIKGYMKEPLINEYNKKGFTAELYPFKNFMIKKTLTQYKILKSEYNFQEHMHKLAHREFDGSILEAKMENEEVAGKSVFPWDALAVTLLVFVTPGDQVRILAWLCSWERYSIIIL